MAEGRMPNPRTDFQQVPLEAAGERERDESRSPSAGKVSCVMCGSPVSLEDCKLNEHGDPVHDGCYLDSVLDPARPRQK